MALLLVASAFRRLAYGFVPSTLMPPFGFAITLLTVLACPLVSFTFSIILSWGFEVCRSFCISPSWARRHPVVLLVSRPLVRFRFRIHPIRPPVYRPPFCPCGPIVALLRPHHLIAATYFVLVASTVLFFCSAVSLRVGTHRSLAPPSPTRAPLAPLICQYARWGQSLRSPLCTTSPHSIPAPRNSSSQSATARDAPLPSASWAPHPSAALVDALPPHL